MLKDFLIEKIKKFSWKEIYNEFYGYVEPVAQEDEPVFEDVKPKKRGISVEVEGKQYNSIREAANDIGMNENTLKDYISRRRTPKVSCKKKIYDNSRN